MHKQPSENPDDQQLIEALQTRGIKALEALYAAYRADFIAFAKKYGAEYEDILDVYQDAIIALYENIGIKKVTLASSSLKTYLFSIGKFKLFDKLKAKGKEVATDEVEKLQNQVDTSFEDQLEVTHRQQLLTQAINILGGQCKELLTLFYYHRYSIDAIRETMDYKNDNTVKANKSRCMKALRAIIDERGIVKVKNNS